MITQLQPISVLFTVPEDNLPAISKRMQERRDAAHHRVRPQRRQEAGATASLETLRQPDRPHHRHDQAAGELSDDDEALYPNQFVNVELLVDTHKDVPSCRRRRCSAACPARFVYLVNADSTVSVRKVDLGVTDGDRVEVKIRPAARRQGRDRRRRQAARRRQDQRAARSRHQRATAARARRRTARRKPADAATGRRQSRYRSKSKTADRQQ